jgi:uncharacterized protein (DUF2126 family)
LGGTARYVDSSVERMQVKVRGMVGERHVVACNGRRVPLRPTGISGRICRRGPLPRLAAAVGPASDHPGPCPLVFDLVDNWNQRSIGGCTYHVMHPGGRSYDTFPVNANEAEARRFARFWPYGHTPGPMTAPAEEPNPNFPYTLDLRHQKQRGHAGGWLNSWAGLGRAGLCGRYPPSLGFGLLAVDVFKSVQKIR